MQLNIKYYNLAGDYLGKREEVRLVDSGITAGKLVQSLAGESEAFRNLAITEEGQISNRIRLFRNDQIVNNLQDVFEDGDRIMIFPAVSGG